MARRIRRDLSNKDIRKIVQEQLKESEESPTHHKKSSNYRFLIYVLIIAVIVIGGLQLTNKVDFREFFHFENMTFSEDPAADDGVISQNNTEDNKPETTNAVPDTASEKPRKPVAQKPQIEVLNGCGAPGIASSVTEFLREKGFDVVYMGNYKNFGVKKCSVVSLIDDNTYAKQIATVLGISEKNVSVKTDRKKQLAASLILGEDFNNLVPFKKN